MTYSPTATGPGQKGYWGDIYGSSAVENQFIVGSWTSKNGQYKGNLGTSKFYPIVNKQTGDIAIVKVNDSGDDITIGTIAKSDGDFKEIDGTTSQAENYYFNLPENAGKVSNHALDIAQKQYNALNPSAQSGSTNPNSLINALNNVAGFSVNQAGAAGVDESVPAPPSSISGNYPPGSKSSDSDKLMVFPSGIQDNGQDYIEFASLEYEPKELSTSGNVGFNAKTQLQQKKVLKRILLPIPGGITDNNAVDWGSANMNAADISKAAIALGAIEDGGEGFTKATEDIAGTIAGNKDTLKESLSKLIAGTVTGTGDQLLKRQTGMVVNPNMELLFNGPQLRTFGFTFKLSPRTSTEATDVVKIIRCFKEAMAPRTAGSNLFLKSPNTWRITYKHRGQDHQYLNRFKECAMMSSSVNYTPDGSYATYSDGSMVSYQLTLNFQELEPVFSSDFQNTPGIGY